MLRKRLDETTLDIITVMLVRNCKLTPADVDVGRLQHKAWCSIRPLSRLRRVNHLYGCASSVHPAIRFCCLGGDDLQPSSLLLPLASCCGSLPQTEPPHLPARTKVHGQQHSTPLQGKGKEQAVTAVSAETWLEENRPACFFDLTMQPSLHLWTPLVPVL